MTLACLNTCNNINLSLSVCACVTRIHSKSACSLSQLLNTIVFVCMSERGEFVHKHKHMSLTFSQSYPQARHTLTYILTVAQSEVLLECTPVLSLYGTQHTAWPQATPCMYMCMCCKKAFWAFMDKDNSSQAKSPIQHPYSLSVHHFIFCLFFYISSLTFWSLFFWLYLHSVFYLSCSRQLPFLLFLLTDRRNKSAWLSFRNVPRCGVSLCQLVKCWCVRVCLNVCMRVCVCTDKGLCTHTGFYEAQFWQCLNSTQVEWLALPLHSPKMCILG